MLKWVNWWENTAHFSRRKGKLEARVKLTEQAAERARSLVAAQALAEKELELRIAEQLEAQAELEAHVADMNALASKLRRFGVRDGPIVYPIFADLHHDQRQGAAIGCHPGFSDRPGRSACLRIKRS